MKSKCSFILKASTALVLALLMLFGTVTTSVAAVVDNAKNTAEADAAESEAHGAEGFFAALRRNTPDLADTGKKADLAETGGQYNIHWNGTVYFRVPDTWNLSTYPAVRCVIRRSTTSTTSGYNVPVAMSVVGGTSYSRLYKCTLDKNHNGWNQNEYLAFFACQSGYTDEGTYALTNTGIGHYTAGLDYGVKDGGKYLFKPSTDASNNSTTTANAIDGTYNGTESSLIVTNTSNQKAFAYTNGSSSATGGTTKVNAYWANGTTPTNSTNSDSPTASYGSAVQGTKVTMTATAKDGYDFAGWYADSSLSTQISNGTANGGNKYTVSDNTLTYYAFKATNVYAKFVPKTYTVSYNKGSNGTGTDTTDTKTHGTALTLKGAIFTRTGYTQTAWNTNSSGTGGTSYALSGSYTANAAVTLYPTWTQNTYAITLNETGGSGTMKIDGTARSSGYAVTHGNHTFSVTAPTGKVVKSISGIGTWSGVGTETATLGSTSITSAQTITVEYEDAGTCGLTLDSTSGSVNIGGTKTITVTPNAYHSGGTISASSSDTSVATASYNSSTRKVTVTGVASGTATITVSCTEGGSATYSVTVNAPSVSAFSYSTANCNIGATSVAPTITTKNPSNSSSLPSGWSIVYSITAGSSYASINASTGVITGNAASGTGGVTVKASFRYNDVEKASKTTTYTINAASISAFSYASAITIGSSSATPTVTASNCGSLTKSFAITSGSDYATINSSTGVVTGRKAGTVTVTVYYKKDSTTIVSKTATVTVSAPTVSFSSTSAATINVGGTVTRAATGSTIGSTGVTSDSITYSSSATDVATVSSTGVITGVTPGNATISAKRTIVCDGKTTEVTTSTNISVTVRTPSITQGNVTIAKGDSKTLSTATTNPSSGLTVTFALSGSPNGVTCTSAGKVTVAQNSTASTATVVATAKNSGGTTVATKNITVTIAAPSLTVKDGSTSVINGTVYTTKGTNKTLTVGTNFSDELTVKSSNTNIAEVSLSGTTLTITPKAKGTCKVSVSTDSGVVPTAAALAETAAAMPQGLLRKVLEIAATGAVATQTAQFTVNVAEADSNKFITYATSSWTGTVYAWYGNAWHTMIKVGTDDSSRTVWALNVGSSYPSTVVFSSQNSWNDGGNGLNQTVDCSVSASANSFYENGQSDGKRNVGSYATTITIPQLIASDVSVKIDQTGTISTTVVNNTTPAKTTYTSNSTSIATVTTAGVVTGKSVGNTTVTVRAWAAKPHSSWTQWITDSTTQALLSGTATSNIAVTADPQTITNSGAYYKTGSAAYASGDTGGTFTVSQTGSLAYNTNITLTATAASGYAVEGIYWSTNGTTWTRVTTTDTTANGYVTKSVYNSFKVTDNFRLKAQFVQVLKLSAFDSYEMKNSQVTFVTAPPKSITIKHTDAHGTATTYTYSYDGTKTAGNPESPDGSKPAALAIATGKYGQGNYIQYYAGDEITLTYSAMASSEILKGVFYDNSKNFYVAKPTSGQFIAHRHPTTPAIYMNGAYYTSAQLGSRDFTGVTADNDAHSIKFTGTQDYKNIDVEIGAKRKVYFSDYTNTVITSKNVDDYYSDNEALSVEGDQLTVKAAGSATQTNSINKDYVKFYRADANGQPTGSELSGFTVTYNDGSDPVTNSGATASTRYIIINGNMPTHDLYIDLGMTNSYTIKLGSKVISDPFENKTRLAQVANITITGGAATLTASTSADVTNSTSVATGTALSLASAFTGSWGKYYMFVGWYWGTDSAPDYEKGFISDKASLNYTPKKGGTIWAVGTRSLYINGSKYITGKDSNWYAEDGTQKNLRMSFDAASGKYYWEITDTMFAAAGSNFKTWKEESSSATTEYGRYHTGDDTHLYWYNTDDKYHGKAFFQILDQESGNSNKTIWKQITSFAEDTPANGPTYGKVYPPEGSYDDKQSNGQGFINFNETNYAGQSSPLRIWYDPNASGNARLSVTATKIYSDLYVSNGYTVGSTLKTSAVTVQPVVDGVVKTSGQTGYFNVGKSTKYTPDVEGEVYKYTPAKKNATVRITKTAGGSDKIFAFLVYDIVNKTVHAERDVKNSGSDYYIDLTLAGEQQQLYIVPIVEEDGANVMVTFDATQLNRAQWGDIVTAYAWYQNNGGVALGDYPGQPMVPSDDMTTWTAKFKGVNSDSKELEGITFSNYVDNQHSWLGCSGVMSTVTYGGAGTSDSPTTVTIADDGLIKQYNYIESGNYKEYSRANFKAQTYDYREPIALYDRFKNSDNVSISFSMKDGNTSLISWRHQDLLNPNNGAGILNPAQASWGLNWEYLTNAKGDKYIDMNGNNIKTKPTASFYVAAKGLVLYDNSSMTNVFYSGKQFDAVSGVTYGGASGVSMNYAVQWYVYDAQGNYITNVLTAGLADLSSNGVDTFIGKTLEDMGYAVDGKSVAICYDKPRYMYNDNNNAGSGQARGYNGKGINVGDSFDAYRFTGQWNAVASNDTVNVKVGVGMMTDSGEVLASSNTAGYGNASASYDTTKGNNTRVTDEDGNEAPFTASDGSFVRTAVRDASNSPVKLNASEQNFIGWYYYDANTGDFVKANYASNEDFYPNYSNKDVTFYAMYKASAVYNYIYRGRESSDDISTWKVYSAAGNALTSEEMANQNKVVYDNHSEDVLNKLPVGIGVFKKNIDFSASSADSWTKNNDTQYILKLSGFNVTSPTYTLTAHYKNASGDLVTIEDSAVYNGKAVNLTTGAYTDSKGASKPAGTSVTSYKPGFIGWYEYNPNNYTIGELLSTQANYGMRLTKHQHIIAVYKDDNITLPTDGWNAYIDENEVNKELTTKDTGVFYNDTIVRVRNGSDVKATLDPDAKIGVIVVCDNKTNKTINGYSDTQLNTLVTRVESGKTMKTASGLSITNMQATTQTSFNRTDIAVRADYAKTLGAKYCVYAYIYDGSTYHFSAASDVKTYE